MEFFKCFKAKLLIILSIFSFAASLQAAEQTTLRLASTELMQLETFELQNLETLFIFGELTEEAQRSQALVELTLAELWRLPSSLQELDQYSNSLRDHVIQLNQELKDLQISASTRGIALQSELVKEKQEQIAVARKIMIEEGRTRQVPKVLSIYNRDCVEPAIRNALLSAQSSRENQVIDLSFLSQMPKLKNLTVIGMKITNLPLQVMEQLEYLDISMSEWYGLKDVSAAPNLRSVYVNWMGLETSHPFIKTLSDPDKTPELRFVDVNYNLLKISDSVDFAKLVDRVVSKFLSDVPANIDYQFQSDPSQYNAGLFSPWAVQCPSLL